MPAGVIDRRVEQGARDSLPLPGPIDDEADDRPDALVLVLRPVLRRPKQGSVLLARRDGDPTNRLAVVVGNQARLLRRPNERMHGALLGRPVLERPVAPVHAPAAVRGHVSVTAARPSPLEEIDQVGPSLLRHRSDPECAHSTSSSRGFARKLRPALADTRPSVITMSAVKSFSPRISAE